MILKQRIETTPSYKLSDEHLWTDYIELCCLSLNEEFTRSEMMDIISPQLNDIDLNLKSSTEKGERAYDRFERRYEVYFDCISNRRLLLKDLYPFKINKGVIYPSQSFSDIHVAYFYLLFCSHLSYFKSEQNVFTTDFEYISLEFLRRIFPNIEHLYVFGKNASGIETRYQGNIKVKLEKLAEDICCTLKEIDYPPTSSGDAGIDIVGWYNPWDKLKGSILIAAQCKCSDEWYDARSAKHKIGQHINLSNDVNNFFFIPFYYRSVSGKWHQPQNADDIILIDRMRLIQDFPLKFFKKSVSYKLVKKLMFGKKSP